LFIGVGAVCGSAVSAGAFYNLPQQSHLIVLLSVAVASAVSFLAFRTRSFRLLLLTASFAFFALNGYLRRPQENPALKRIAESSESPLFEVEVTGSIFVYPNPPEESRTERYSCIVELKWFESDGKRRYADACLLLRLRLRSGIGLLCGDIIRTYGRVYSISRKSRLYYRGVDGVLVAGVRDFVSLERRGSGGTLSDIRAHFGKELDSLFGAETEAASFARALLLGERHAVPAKTRHIFQKTGTSHILALSGIHLALLALIAGGLIRFLFFPKKRHLELVIVIGLSFLYFLIGGMRPSLFRALTVILIYWSGILLGRRREGFNSLGAAVAILLFLFPFDVLSVSFQLTFITFAGVVLLCPFYLNYIERRLLILQMKGYTPDYTPFGEYAFWFISVTLYLSTTAWLSAQPLIGYHFGIIPYGTLFANIAIFPFFLLSLLCALLMLPLLLLCPLFAYPLAEVFIWLYRIIVFVTEAIADAGLYTFVPNRYLPAFNIPAVVIFYTVILLAGLRIRGYLPRLRRHHLALLALSACSIWVVGGKLSEKPPSLKKNTVEFLPVGQGLSVLMNIEGSIILYDCGSMRYADRTGIVVAEHLHDRNIRHIDALVLSHTHSDHINGARELAERISIGRVFVSEWFGATSAGRRLLNFFSERDIAVSTLKAPARIGDRIRVLAPLTDSLFRQELSENDLSLVLLVELDNARLLLTGDLEDRGAAVLLLSGVDIRCNVMQLPHHGHKHLLLAEFVSATGAKKFIISGSTRELEGFEGAEVYATDECGVIIVSPNGEIEWTEDDED